MVFKAAECGKAECEKVFKLTVFKRTGSGDFFTNEDRGPDNVSEEECAEEGLVFS